MQYCERALHYSAVRSCASRIRAHILPCDLYEYPAFYPFSFARSLPRAARCNSLTCASHARTYTGAHIDTLSSYLHTSVRMIYTLFLINLERLLAANVLLRNARAASDDKIQALIVRVSACLFVKQTL